jgi:hypothetical protein
MRSVEYLETEASGAVEEQLGNVLRHVSFHQTRKRYGATRHLADANEVFEQYVSDRGRRLYSYIESHFTPRSRNPIDRVLLRSQRRMARKLPIISDIWFSERSARLSLRGEDQTPLDNPLVIRESRICGDMIIGNDEFVFDGSSHFYVTLAESHDVASPSIARYDYAAKTGKLVAFNATISADSVIACEHRELKEAAPYLALEENYLALCGMLKAAVV